MREDEQGGRRAEERGRTPAQEGERSSPPPRDKSGRPASAPLSATLERLGAHTPDQGRYAFLEEVARGGMGVIQRVWDGDLGRAVARKILGRDGQGSDSRRSDPRTVGRFLEEAQITAQLEHPGIVPVHELGLDAKGTLYFTMRLVRGEDLHKVFEHVRTGQDGWNITRALGVLLKACEALSFAHKKGVIHRDLKPANVMVGRFGEVYVMDWGLARVVGEPAATDDPPREGPGSVAVHAAGRREGDTPDSPLLTREGDVIGTPAYMSPEQARGELGQLDTRTDVYALGAMLYHLLAGRVPYSEPGRRLEAQVVLQRVLDGPPTPLGELAPPRPPELLAICERAMARRLEQRYATVAELADDLRAYLELRVVRAYRTGPLVELAKWVRRNRLSAASLAALVGAVAISGFALAHLESSRRAAQELELAERSAAGLVAEVDQLWPIRPDLVEALRTWLYRAHALVERLPAAQEACTDFEREQEGAVRLAANQERGTADADAFALRSLEHLRSEFGKWARFLREGEHADLNEAARTNELAYPEANLAVLERELPWLGTEVARRQAALERTRTWRYADPVLENAYARRHAFAQSLADLARPGGAIDEVEGRLGRAEELLAIAPGTESEGWSNARASIADRGACPLYDGLSLAPQLGLVPLRRDPHSGLWEFWHVLSGDRPELAGDGSWSLTPSTGIVLVLVPGGRVTMGSQDDDPDAPNYFAPEEGVDEGLQAVDRWQVAPRLDPFFLGKHELTQGQWIRMANSQPSVWFAGASFRGMARLSRLHPVEQVSWFDAQRVLARHGLTLPTEAQWERAARAGTQWKYCAGETLASVLPLANFADRRWSTMRPGEGYEAHDDGWITHAPVASFRSNAWGFHEIVGNVAEWCLDWYASSCERGALQDGAGEHVPRSGADKAVRGGSMTSLPSGLWASSRYGAPPGTGSYDIGMRAARMLNP
jgi:formylglycine-generating enzyme required for sulfatase activity/serine/threonine protein kinase